jgi:hypothetical protein
MATKRKTYFVYRNAITGRYTSRRFAEGHPDITIRIRRQR